MDLDFAIDQLDVFATFGKNIGDVLTGLPDLLQTLISFFTGGAEDSTAETSSIIEAGSSTEE
ncbi:hypothetical protein COCCU_12205 [Corynebacterium occultum]|uniref:Uncharacterized protein n=1 Tax=Corynebacterium occultum TaxID=2675219 RepID=A0A6B8W6U4_9CORY|nr:PorH family porin [Corynebacterium occultum]QGU08341.1 hypothetical protein COCCU_12205 [Corynebacterium occultum]